MATHTEYFKKPQDFRKWLAIHHLSATEILVCFYKVASGIPSMTWSQSVDQALCFGWIDGIRRRVDENRYTIRFTPRRPKSTWSAINIGKVAELKKQGLMQPAGLKAYSMRSDERSVRYSYEQQKIELDKKSLAEFRRDKVAWEFFQKLPPSARRPSVWWVMSGKHETTRQRRLKKLIQCSGKGEKIPGLIIGKSNK